MASFVPLECEGPLPPSGLTLTVIAAHQAVSVTGWSILFEWPTASPGVCCHIPVRASLCGAVSEVAQFHPGGRQALRQALHASSGAVSSVVSAQRAVFCTRFLPLIVFYRPLPHIAGALLPSALVADNPTS